MAASACALFEKNCNKEEHKNFTIKNFTLFLQLLYICYFIVKLSSKAKVIHNRSIPHLVNNYIYATSKFLYVTLLNHACERHANCAVHKDTMIHGDDDWQFVKTTCEILSDRLRRYKNMCGGELYRARGKLFTR